MEKLPKREYPVERVIGPGFDEEDYEIARSFFRGQFENQDFVKDIEREKTEEEEQIISWVNDETNALFEHYGVRPLDIPSRNVHIIPKERWPKYPGFEDSAAFYSFDTQAIFYRDKPLRSLFAFRVFHEQLHIKSHQAARYVEEGGTKKFEEYRSGLGLSSAKREDSAAQFRKLNEAVIETLAIRFWKEKIAKNERFREEMEALARVKQVLRGERAAIKENESVSEEEAEQIIEEICAATDGEEGLMLECFSYPLERSALAHLVNTLHERNKATAQDPSQIFDLFVKSAMTGHMVELAKLIDKTFGAGTFKRLGAISSEKHTKEELLDFIKNL
ncbi:MAG: hypothetical protein Q8Q41_00015 [bacterium]|nr:hypothetical protein [bacterium]